MTTSPSRAPGPDQAPPPGLTVGGYRLLARLGEGGMGVVHLAQRPGGDRVALKVIRPHVVSDDEARSRLAREVGSLSRIRSNRVAEILDADPWGEIPYVATRYVPGLPLHDEVQQQGPIAGRDLVWFAQCLAEALAAVHRVGVLHRDVKPSNVLMEGRSPVLIDFGLARVADDPRITQVGWLLGTPGYLAPEILHGQDASAASDVHSWAATVAYAGTGRAPFGRGPSMAIMDRVRRGEHDLTGLSGVVEEVVRAALDPEPTARPTLPEVMEILAGRSSTALPLRRRTRLLPEGLPESAPEPHPQPFHQRAPEPWDDLADADADADADAAEAEAGAEADAVEQGWGPPVEIEARASILERLRRAVLLLGAGAAAAGATALAPYLTCATLLVLTWLLRSGSLGASAAAERRRARGPKWYDVAQSVVSAPYHLLAAVPRTLLLGLWAGGLGLVAALLAFAVALPVSTSLMIVGGAFVLGIWAGPGGSRVRRPIRAAVHPLAARPVVWLITAAVVLSVASGFWSLAGQGEVDWSPGSHAPWQNVSLF